LVLTFSIAESEHFAGATGSRRSLPTTLFSGGQKKGHYVAFGPTSEGRCLAIIFELKPKGLARPITGWDMKQTEIRYYKKHRGKK